MIMPLCKRFLISGRVQGVWFRAATQQQAQQLGLGGYANNLPDGGVEVLACGNDDKLDQLEAWLWQGPAQAKVHQVIAEEVEYRELNDFTTG
jgi:acylphosphatase